VLPHRHHGGDRLRQSDQGLPAGPRHIMTGIVVIGTARDGRILVWSHQWIAAKGYAKRNKTLAYDTYIERGELTVFQGGLGDIDGFVEIIRILSESGKLRRIGVDNYAVVAQQHAFEDLGEVVGVAQGWKLTPSITFVERSLASDTIRHSGTSILHWNILNAVATRHGNGVSITKETAVGGGKVDGVMALLNAITAYNLSVRAEEEAPYADGRGLTFV
jgi:phage terminase large subunit-like protein